MAACGGTACVQWMLALKSRLRAEAGVRRGHVTWFARYCGSVECQDRLGNAIPAVSECGMFALALLILTVGTLAVRRKARVMVYPVCAKQPTQRS